MSVKVSDALNCQQQALSLLDKIASNLAGMIFRLIRRADGSLCALYASSGCRKLCELEPEVVQADFQMLRSLIHPQDIQSFDGTIIDCTAKVTPWHWSGRIITPSGKIKWIQGASHVEQFGTDILWDGLLIDVTETKEMEEKLQQSEARYKAILDAIPDLMFRINADGEYLDCKSESANINIPREDILGKTLSDLLPSDVALTSQEAIRKTLDTKTLQTCEYILPTPLGLRDYEARLVVCGEDEILAIVRDITERKQAEITLRQSKEKFETAFRCSPHPITISTIDEGRYLEVNESFVKLSGFTREEAIGRTSSELNIWVNPSDRNRLLQELQQKGEVRNLELEFCTKSGQTFYSSVCAEVIDLDGVKCLLAVNHDITERKQKEDLLRISAQRDRLLTTTLSKIRTSINLDEILQTTVNEVRQLLQADRVLIGLLDPKEKGEVVAESVNPNYPSVLGKVVSDRQYLEHITEKFTQSNVCIVEDTTTLQECSYFSQHTASYQVKATLGVPIMVGGNLLGVLVAHQCSGPRNWQSMEIDLLQRMSEPIAIAIQQAQLYQELAALNVNLERQVEERTAQLQQKMKEIQELNCVKDVVLHTISHDLRTTVMGNLMVLNNLLKNQGMGNGEWGVGKENTPHSPLTTPLVPVPRSIIERMIKGNDRQMTMINSLLEINSIEVEGVVLQKELVNINTLIEAIIKDLEPTLAQNQATIANLIPTELPLAMVDPAQLQRVFVNLFTHSLQNNPPGLNITLNATIEGGMIRCFVHDNGIAMSKLECDRLFELYVRDPQARSSTNIGLKMYLCQQIVLAHGGEIGVESHPSRGITFWFTLPLAA